MSGYQPYSAIRFELLVSPSLIQLTIEKVERTNDQRLQFLNITQYLQNFDKILDAKPGLMRSHRTQPKISKPGARTGKEILCPLPLDSTGPPLHFFPRTAELRLGWSWQSGLAHWVVSLNLSLSHGRSHFPRGASHPPPISRHSPVTLDLRLLS